MPLKQHSRSASRGDNAEVSEVDDARWGDMFVERDGVSEIWTYDGGDWRRVHRACVIRAWRSNAHNVANNTWEEMSFDREDYDTDGVWAATSTQFLPSVPGYYLVTGSVAWTADGTGHRWIGVRKNDDEIFSIASTPGDAASVTHVETTHIVYLNGTTDYVELIIRQTSGGALDTESTGDDQTYSHRYCGAIALVGAVDQW